MSFLDSLTVQPLPPGFKPGGFDCGEQELTDYLCDGTAQEDEKAGVARTYLVMSEGEFVAYFSVLADAIRLETKERPPGCRYSSAPALKLGRMGRKVEVKGSGIGPWILDYVVGMARDMSKTVGVRYVTLDALKRDRLVAMYEGYGFEKNKGHAKGLAKLLNKNRDELEHVSMRFDILLQPEVVSATA